jgi:hypothetical protein
MATSTKGLTFALSGRVAAGRLDADLGAVRRALAAWPDCDVTVTVEADEAKRSIAANRYLFGVIYRDIEEYTGQPKEQIHDEMCVRFTSETVSYVNPKTGEMVETVIVRRTSGMRVSRFHTFVQDVKLFASEFFGLTFEDAPREFYVERDRALARDAKRKDAA